MRVCDDIPMQDALLDYVQGRLSAETAAAVRAHLAGCAACAEEVAVITQAGEVIVRTTPTIDVARIVAAVEAGAVATGPASGPDSPTVSPMVFRTRRWWASRQILAAAASILVVVSLTIPTLRGTPEGAILEVPLDSVSPVTEPSGMPSTSATSVSVDFAGGLADLSSAQLETLLSALDALEGTVRAEPASIALPLFDTPEVL